MAAPVAAASAARPTHDRDGRASTRCAQFEALRAAAVSTNAANVTIDCRTGIDHERRPVAAVEHVRVRARERHRRGIGCADERYHAFSSAGGIAKSSALAAGMIVRTGLERAKRSASSTEAKEESRSRCLIVG